MSILEWIHAKLYGDDSPHPSGKSKIKRWREYPLEPDAHQDHTHSGTKATYGKYRVYYCYDCGEHYRARDGTQPGWRNPYRE